MAKIRHFGFVLLILCTIQFQVLGQSMADLPAGQAEEYKDRVKGLAMFLQFMLNTIGDESTPVKEREVIINESYRKIFRDADVQIEDDLLADRQAINNKPVTAYLRDVDFFFKDARFQFDILDVLVDRHEDGGVFFKVVMDRTLSAVNVDGGSVKNTQKRFVEVNWDRTRDELKIASIYTTKMSRDEELQNWWNSLSFQWISIFMNKYGIDNEVDIPTLYKIIDTDSLHLADNPQLIDLKPVEILSKLKYIDFSSTRVTDLSPLRGLTQLRYVNANYTLVEDLVFLQFCRQIEVLKVADAPLKPFAEWQNFGQLQILELAGSGYENFDFLKNLPSLVQLNLSGAPQFNDLSTLSKNTKLQTANFSGTGITSIVSIPRLQVIRELDLSGTTVSDVSSLASLTSLETLRINNCPVTDISPLTKLPNLRKVYADNSGVQQEMASNFMATNSKVLVMVNARENEQWWRNLPVEWQEHLQNYISVPFNRIPSIEILTGLFNIDSLSLNDTNIREAKPLEKFTFLKVLDISDTRIRSLDFVSKLPSLRVLRMSGLGVADITPLAKSTGLRSLTADRNTIRSLQPIMALTGLAYLNIDQSMVGRDELRRFVAANPNCEVIFDSAGLEAWWGSLDAGWRQYFAGVLTTSSPDTRTLHRLVLQPSLALTGMQINSLRPLEAFVYLRELKMHTTAISHLSDLPGQLFLESLTCSKSPLVDISALANFKALRHLNLSDTPIEKLSPIFGLYNLETLNLSGTNVKNLKGMESLTGLRSFDCSNTSIKNLSALLLLPSLRHLTCFNTGVKEKQMQEFRTAQPSCEVVYY